MRREGARDVASAGPRISIPRSHGRQGPSLRLASRSLTASSRGKYAQIRRQARTKWYAAVQRRGLTGAAFSDIDHPLRGVAAYDSSDSRSSPGGDLELRLSVRAVH